MTPKRKLLFYCQYLLGMGHLVRSMEIVRGLNEFDVRFLNGGQIVPGFKLPAAVDLVNLPPIKSDETFSELFTFDQQKTLEEIKQIRAERVLAEYENFRPDVVVIELFPFGRLKFAFELIPWLERARADGGVKVVCSVRDILVGQRDPQTFEDRVCQRINQFFDLVLIHSDPHWQSLGETFGSLDKLNCPVRYTGYVAQPAKPDGEASRDPFLAGAEKIILVSVGGGRVGGELIDCAIDASELIAQSQPHRMLIFAGPYPAAEEFQRMQQKVAARPNIRLSRYTTDFPAYMERADLSISMAGYNTCMNIVTASQRAVVYPFTRGGNEEQARRAEKLHSLGLAEVIYEEQLTPATLAEKALLALAKPKPAIAAVDLNGVEQTAQALKELVAGVAP
ncbi:MAG: glycosyltransferase family protein [Blastocatellia bacterium]